MRRYCFTAEAQTSFDHHIDYLIERNPDAAARLNDRVHAFIRNTLCHFPRSSRYIPERAVWETWIPGTRIVVWYVYDDDAVTIIALWHTAQDHLGQRT